MTLITDEEIGRKDSLMDKKLIYLDNAATTRTNPEVVKAMIMRNISKRTRT